MFFSSSSKIAGFILHYVPAQSMYFTPLKCHFRYLHLSESNFYHYMQKQSFRGICIWYGILFWLLHIVCQASLFFYMYFDQNQAKTLLVISNLMTIAIKSLKLSLKLIIRYFFTEFSLVIYILFIFWLQFFIKISEYLCFSKNPKKRQFFIPYIPYFMCKSLLLNLHFFCFFPGLTPVFSFKSKEPVHFRFSPWLFCLSYV